MFTFAIRYKCNHLVELQDEKMLLLAMYCMEQEDSHTFVSTKRCYSCEIHSNEMERQSQQDTFFNGGTN